MDEQVIVEHAGYVFDQWINGNRAAAWARVGTLDTPLAVKVVARVTLDLGTRIGPANAAHFLEWVERYD